MKYQIRRNVFETNSSSVHVIAIGKEDFSYDLPIDKKVNFCLGSFGDENTRYTDYSERASYLYTAIYSIYEFNEDRRNARKFIRSTLSKYGIEAVFEDEVDHEEYYGIWHNEELEDWLIKILTSEKLLMHFLFSPDSVILTGNNCFTKEIDSEFTDPNKYLDLTRKNC